MSGLDKRVLERPRTSAKWCAGIRTAEVRGSNPLGFALEICRFAAQTSVRNGTSVSRCEPNVLGCFSSVSVSLWSGKGKALGARGFVLAPLLREHGGGYFWNLTKRVPARLCGCWMEVGG